MTGKRKIAALGVLCLLLLYCVLASLYWLVPWGLNSERFFKMVRETGLTGFSWSVRRVGLTGADIGDLRIGGAEKKAISVETVMLNYSLKGLRRGTLERVRFSGIEIHCGISQGQFYFQGFDPGPLLNRGDRPTPAGAPPPLTIATLEFSGATVVLDMDGKRLRIPLEAIVTPQPRGRFHIGVTAHPRGQEIGVQVDLDPGEKTARLAVKADRLQPERFGDLLELAPGLRVSGDASITASADLRIDPFEIANFDAALDFKNRGAAYQAFRLKAVPDASAEDELLQVKVQSADGKTWDAASTSAEFESPVPFRIAGVEARIERSEDRVSCSGKFMIEAAGAAPGGAGNRFGVVSRLKSGWRFSATASSPSDWEVQLQTLKPEKPPDKGSPPVWEGEINGVRYACQAPEASITARLEAGNITAGAEVKIPEASASFGPSTVRIPTLWFKGNALLFASGTTRAEAAIGATGVTVKTDSARVGLPETVLSARVQIGKDGVPRGDGVLKTVNGNLVDTRAKVRVEGVDAAFPFNWPWAASEPAGKVSIRSVRGDGIELGSLTGTIRQGENGVLFQATHLNRLIPGLVLNLKGESLFFGEINRNTVHFKTRYSPSSPLDLGRFHPSAKGVQATGELDLGGECSFDRLGPGCSLHAVLDKAGFTIPGKGIAAENIRLLLDAPDALAMATARRQRLEVETVSLGNIRLQDAKVEFQIESDRSVFIEKASFNWCGGRVSPVAFRVKPGVTDYDLVLYCDRLKLTDLLMQLGVAQAEGDGEVSGRIHVRIKDGEFSVDDGFLFSTPGEGGTIHVTRAETLTEGIARNTPQYAQLDLAREALKDYDYEWVRLGLNTEGEKLMIRMTFDGKPANPLPFVYKKEFGGFVRDTTGKQQSRFQGIRLNVNLGLPLNQLLRYKGIIDNLSNP